MTDSFLQDYYCLELETKGGEILNFEAIQGEVCRMIHINSKQMALISQDTQKLNITEMFQRGKKIELAKIRYMIAVKLSGRDKPMRQTFYHPFKSPTYLKTGKLFCPSRNLLRKQPLNTLFEYPFPDSVVGSQFIS